MASFNVLRIQMVNNKPVSQFCRACGCKIIQSACEIENNPAKPELPLLLKRYIPEFDVKIANACLCAVCVSILYTFHNFKRKCLRMEEDLRLHVRQHPEVKIVDLNDFYAPKKPKHTVTNATTAAVKIFPCKLCDGSFRTKAKLDCHNRDFHEPERFQCNQCSRKFISKNLYDAHTEYHKTPDSGRFVCKICNFVYHAANSLNRHNVSKHVSDDEKPFKCTVCARVFIRKYLLDTHMRQHNKEQYRYRCTLCNFGTNAMIRLDRHLSRSHRRTVNCRICNRTYSSEETLNNHIRHQHHKCIHYQCTQCSRTFGLRTVYDRHLAYHKTPDAGRYICKICNFVFHSHTSIGIHKRLMHGIGG